MPEFELDGPLKGTFTPAGFRELEFRGLGPINAFVWSTSIPVPARQPSLDLSLAGSICST